MDSRKAKRLAHRIRAHARRERLPRVVWTSPLERCRAVGCWLRGWGWEQRVDERLIELDFGAWDGLPWAQIPKAEIDAWSEDLLHYRPGGGEPLAALFERVRSVFDETPAAVLVTHGGWLSAAQWLRTGPGDPSASRWPRAPGYGGRVAL